MISMLRPLSSVTRFLAPAFCLLAFLASSAVAQTVITSSTTVSDVTYNNAANPKASPLTVNTRATFTGTNINITAAQATGDGRMALRLNAGATANIRGGFITQTRSGPPARGIYTLAYLYGNARLDASDIVITTTASEPDLRPLGVNGSQPNRIVLNRAIITSGGNVTALILAGAGTAALNSSIISTTGKAAPGVQMRGHRAGFTLSLDSSLVRARGVNASGIHISGQDFGAGGSSRVNVSLKNTTVTSEKGAGIDINTPVAGLGDVDTRTKIPDGWKGSYEITLENTIVTGPQAALRVTSDPIEGSADRELPTAARITIRSASALVGKIFAGGSASLVLAIDNTSAVTGPVSVGGEAVLTLDTERFHAPVALGGESRLLVNAPLMLTGPLVASPGSGASVVLDIARGARLVLAGTFAIDGTLNLVPENLPSGEGSPKEIQIVEDMTGKFNADAFKLANAAGYALQARSGGVWLVRAGQ